MKILLIDDSKTIRSIQKNALKQIGYEDVAEAADGLEALAAFANERPDLLIVDWNMPNMDGITLVRKIREQDKTVPMIMCTTEAEKQRVMEAIKAGVNDYIVKPFTPDGLNEKISRVIGKATAAT
ncbi:MAG: response regulator [Planctomycetes bacterium]|nr:response regulator [Planctomycetota bacterium]